VRAVFIHGIRDVRLGELPPPVPAADEVLVEVEAVGLCGSDLHYFKEGRIGSGQVIREPFVPGHEIAGRLAQDVPARGWTRGTRVVVEPSRACGMCEWCEAGHLNLCPNVIFKGAPPYPGGLTAQIAVRPQELFPVPATFSPALTAALEPMGVCLHAIDLAKPRLLETVAVLGCGPIGLGIIQLLKLASPAAIWAVDPAPSRADAALANGATHAADRLDAIRDWSAGRGADLVMEATNSPDAFQDAAVACRIGGRIVLVGIPDGDSYRLEASLARRKGLSIKLSRRMGHVLPRVIELAARGLIEPQRLVSHEVALEETADALARMAVPEPGVLKVVVRPDGA
jgi:L-iditol 2-dehydrogenase